MSYKYPLKDPQRMTELFGLLHKAPSARYQDKELNEALNNALFLEDEEQAIIASGRYSIRVYYMADTTGTQSFCAAMKPPMERTAAWSRHSLRSSRLWTIRGSLTAIRWRP